MFGDYVLKKTSAIYDERILFIDDDDLDEKTHYSEDFSAYGFEVVRYQDDLSFRLAYDGKLDEGKLIVIAHSDDYIPYDIQCRLRTYRLSLSALFPELNVEVLRERSQLNFDLLCLAYNRNFEQLNRRKQTEEFLTKNVYGKDNVTEYLQKQMLVLNSKVQMAKKYSDWFNIAEMKASVDVLAAQYSIDINTSTINASFKDYILTQFGKLSSEITRESPVLVSRAMEYMSDRSDKFVIIVMDGMSEFDWKILATSFDGIEYRQAAAFAMIPTTTSISRQCLLSNKYPVQLMEPWKQSKEKAEFVACAKNLGYSDGQIGYARGYDAEFSSVVRCGAIIINDIDDMVHGQQQGRLGMYNDVRLLATQKKLVTTVKRFRDSGYDVYISADHGNTDCVGLGRLMGTGLEVETKSHRMIVLQDFADKDKLIQQYGLIEYPKFYLDKKYDYLICNTGESFDAKGEEVMTHGGISIDEVVVPFIEIKAV